MSANEDEIYTNELVIMKASHYPKGSHPISFIWFRNHRPIVWPTVFPMWYFPNHTNYFHILFIFYTTIHQSPVVMFSLVFLVLSSLSVLDILAWPIIWLIWWILLLIFDKVMNKTIVWLKILYNVTPRIGSTTLAYCRVHRPSVCYLAPHD